MSQVIYNGVTLPYCFLTRNNQECVLDDYSNTVRILHRFDIEVEATVRLPYMNLLAGQILGLGNFPNLGPADLMNIIRSTLLKPRKTLSVQFNGVELIPQVGANAGSVDSMNGPIPQSCQILDMSNDTFLISFHIIAHYAENSKIQVGQAPAVLNQQTGPVLYNRWTESVDIDKVNLVTRTREGKFVIRTDNSNGVFSDQLRAQFAVVSVPTGFLRQGSNYVQTPDGLGLQYRVTDKEVFKGPPKPAFTAEGEYTETTANNGAFRTAHVRIKLEGDKNTSQSDLIYTCVSVCASKLILRSGQLQLLGLAQKFNIINSATLRTGMYDNWVECDISAAIPIAKGRISGVAGFAGLVPFTPGSESRYLGNTYAPNYLVRGTGGILLQAAAYYDPALNQNGQLGPANPFGPNPSVPNGSQQVQMPGLIPGQAGKTLES